MIPMMIRRGIIRRRFKSYSHKLRHKENEISLCIKQQLLKTDRTHSGRILFSTPQIKQYQPLNCSNSQLFYSIPTHVLLYNVLLSYWVPKPQDTSDNVMSCHRTEYDRYNIHSPCNRKTKCVCTCVYSSHQTTSTTGLDLESQLYIRIQQQHQQQCCSSRSTPGILLLAWRPTNKQTTAVSWISSIESHWNAIIRRVLLVQQQQQHNSSGRWWSTHGGTWLNLVDRE